MLYREHRPAPPLSRFVHRLWYCEAYTPAHPIETILPTGRFEIVINLDRPHISNFTAHHGKLETIERASALITGVHTKPMLVSTQDMRRLIGVSFHAGGAPALLNLPAHECTNLDIDLDAGGLRERLLASHSTQAAFRILEAWLTNRLGHGLPSHPAIDWSLRHMHLPLPELLHHTNLSARRFREAFRAQVGVSPKLYQRIQRFRAAVLSASDSKGPNWTKLAQDCGYFDQAHFNHDFTAFSGLTPSAYAERRQYWAFHVAADPYKILNLTSAMIEET
jgi:AraC-like DNA-binding protein